MTLWMVCHTKSYLFYIVCVALIGGVLSCSCPDNEHRKQTCKHLLFVLFRVFGFDSSEANKLTLADVLKKAEVREKLWLERAQKAQAEGKKVEESKVERREFKNEDCPICYEKMESDEGTTWCRESCGNSMHSGCLDEWLQRHSTCVLCRAKLKFNNRQA
jgi:HRD ubiquitin ligase complex, ER membrane component